jgi:DNA-binding NarL/FixJ family response regulator
VIRIVIVDDQALMRDGLRGLLKLAPGIEVVGEAADGDTAVTLIQQMKPDAVLLDVRMPRGDGISVLTRLTPPPPTILLTTFDDDRALLQGIRAGARGFLLKDVSFDDLLDAIRRVHAGEMLIRPGVGEHVQQSVQRIAPDFEAIENPDALTRRERDVIRLLAQGCSNREIAEQLGTGEGTVKNHCSNIFAKLGVRDRTRAVLRAIQLGIL